MGLGFCPSVCNVLLVAAGLNLVNIGQLALLFWWGPPGQAVDQPGQPDKLATGLTGRPIAKLIISWPGTSLRGVRASPENAPASCRPSCRLLHALGCRKTEREGEKMHFSHTFFLHYLLDLISLH